MKPRRDWGRALVIVPWNNPETLLNGVVLPRDYELAGDFGRFFDQPNRMGFVLMVTGPDVPTVEPEIELPYLRVDAHRWQKLVVYPYEET